MYTIKLYSSGGSFIGETTEEDIEDVMDVIKSHITHNDTIVVVSDSEFIDGIEVI